MRVTVRQLLVVLISLCAVPAYAQFDTASVVGTVRDSTAAAVPDATVTLTNSETGVSLNRTTNGEGVYEFATVRPGTYVITSEKAGFAIALIDDVRVQVGARQRIDLQMSVGQVSERLEVTAAAPLVETETSQRGQLISETAIRELPLNGREYSSLALLTTRRPTSATSPCPSRIGCLHRSIVMAGTAQRPRSSSSHSRRICARSGPAQDEDQADSTAGRKGSER
jgi:hypothetical protein